jgi:RND family efflux transporter MFP subunit
MKKITYFLILFTLILISSCENNQKKLATTPTVQVTLNTPILRNGNFITASGKVETVQNANLSTRIMGFVDQVYVKVGQKVSKGQLLLSINSTDITAKKAQVNASITEATAAFNNAKKDFDRYTALYKAKSVSPKEMDDITTNYKMAKARLDAAIQMKNQINSQLSYANITAPFSGVITGKYINKGDMANPGIPLISLETPEKYQVITLIPESDITAITPKEKVKVLIKSTKEVINGTVTEISTSATNTSGQYMVKILLDKSASQILSGMFTSVQFPVKSMNSKNTSNTILISKKALIHKGQLTGVYTVTENNIALLRWLRIGKTFNENVEVLSGLNSSENYVISSNGKLFNGAKVTIQN